MRRRLKSDSPACLPAALVRQVVKRPNIGKLTRQEFLAGQPNPEEAPKRFPRFDTNHDGELSREEFIGGGR